MSMLDVVYNSFGNTWILIGVLLLYSISWFRGDAQKNIKKYERWDRLRQIQKRASPRERV